MSLNLNPEHVHVMLNHIPVVGFAVAALLLLYALLLREKHTLAVGLGLCAVLALMTSVVMWTGEEGHKRLEEGALAGLVDEAGDQWMETHEERAEIVAIGSYIVGGLAGVGLIVGLVAASWRRRIAGIMLVLVLVLVAGMAWVADAGGKIRHPEFRAGGVGAPAEEPESGSASGSGSEASGSQGSGAGTEAGANPDASDSAESGAGSGPAGAKSPEEQDEASGAD